MTSRLGTGAKKLLALTLSFSLLAGCTQDGEQSGGTLEPEETLIELPYEAEVRGNALNLAFRGVTELRIFRLTGVPPEFADMQLLSVHPSTPLEAGSGARFQVLFDIVGYEGEGSYTILPRPSADDLGNEEGNPILSGSDLSNVRVEYLSPEGESVQFRALEPCEVEISHEGTQGSLTCPLVGSDNGLQAQVRVTWG